MMVGGSPVILSPKLCRTYLEDLERFGIKLGLENIRALLHALGKPHLAFPSVLVAGTNGKGSVCAMLARILSLHGLAVGLYTSPHLVRVEERIRVGSRMIPQKDFCRLAGVVKQKTEVLLSRKKLEASPTFFEVLTALAFLYFHEKKVDIAVLEVGMGGRFDATNVVRPLVSVITTVTRDHQGYLGRTIGRIAFEKAGIIKPGVPVVCGVESGEALRVIEKWAAEVGAPFVKVFGKDGRFESHADDEAYRFTYRHSNETFCFSPRLAGEHQGRNGAVAVAAASALNRVWRPLDKRKIIKGVEEARWPGRLEPVSRNPLIVLDGAHNEAGAAALKKYIGDFLKRPPVLVFAMMKDKAIGRVADLLFPSAKKIILTSIPFARAATPDELASQARPFRNKMAIEPSLGRALRLAGEEAGRRGAVIVTGSLFLVGEAKRLFFRKTGKAA